MNIKIMSKQQHFYVFYIDEVNRNFYDRTCGDKKATEERLIELKKIYYDAIYFEGDIPKEFKYFY